jgi:hypothetical protein
MAVGVSGASVHIERRIDQTTYESQRDRCREELALLEIELHETRLEELDVEGLLAFSEEDLTDAAQVEPL